MRSGLGTTAATYAVLCLAGSVPLFMPESVALPDAWGGGDAPARIELRGTMRAVRTGDSRALPPAQPFTITLERRAESGVYVSSGARRANLDRGSPPARHATFELSASFTHDEGAGHFVRVSGADATILVGGRPVACAGSGEGLDARTVRMDALEHLEDGRSYEIGFLLTESGETPPAFRIETTLRLRKETTAALTSAAR